jgi:transcription elongation factor GreB
MSKAFTKDIDQDDDEEIETPVVSSGKNYMTPAGANKLRQEMKALLDGERPEVVRTVSWAASNGDRSENGDYLYGKKRLREIDKRIRYLTKRLEIVTVVDPTTQKSDRVLFGASVVVVDESGAKRCYRIVGVDEADAGRGHVSWVSPIAKALLQAQVGDVVTLKTPKGDEELEVMEIRYEPIP